MRRGSGRDQPKPRWPSTLAGETLFDAATGISPFAPAPPVCAVSRKGPRRPARGDEQGPAAGRAPDVVFGVRVSQYADYTESPMPRASTPWGRVRLHVENVVAAPTRVHTIPKGALIMVISTRFSISTDGYEESND